MQTLNDILGNMDGDLFTPSEEEPLDNKYSADPHPVYDEYISNETAQALLGDSDYEDKYQYKLVTTIEGFVVVKFDSEHNEILGEYELSQDSVQSYEDMTHSVLLKDRSVSTEHFLSGLEYNPLDESYSIGKIEDSSKGKFNWNIFFVLILSAIVVFALMLNTIFILQ